MSKSRKSLRRSFPKRLGFEQLENRKLLAADLMAGGAIEVDSMEFDNTPCMVASAEFPAETLETIGSSIEVEPTEADPRNLDLADGMDGYFGSISPDNPSETLQFTAAEDGVVDIVVASSFGESQTQLSVTDRSGTVMESSVEGLDGFGLLSFEASQGETYQVTVSSDDAEMEGQFQMTVGFEKFVDQHSDVVGEESTELEFTDNQTEISGRLEGTGDTDSFRFNASESGEMFLSLSETVEDSRVGLNVTVSDLEGVAIANGSTNELLQISFDVESGNEYFVSVTSSEGQKGTYQFGMLLEPSDTIVDEAADEETTETEDEVLITDDLQDPETDDSEVTDETDAVDVTPEEELDDVIDDSSTSEILADPAVEPIVCEFDEVVIDETEVTEDEVIDTVVVDFVVEDETVDVVDEVIVEVIDVTDDSTAEIDTELGAENETTDDSDNQDVSEPVQDSELETTPIPDQAIEFANDVPDFDPIEPVAETTEEADPIVDSGLDLDIVPVETDVDDDETNEIVDIADESPIEETIDSIVDFVESEVDCEFDNLDELFAQLGDEIEDAQASLASGPFGFFPNFKGFGFFRI